MSDLQWGHANYVVLLALVGIAGVLMVFGAWSRQRNRAQFVSSTQQFSPRLWGGLLLLLSMGLTALGAMDLRWGRQWQDVPQKGLEVVFLLDVSRSMLAEDTSPNRLTRAKQQISDMLEAMAGDRVGLIIFAGEARQSVPLTSHYPHFTQVLGTVGPDLIRGGSRLGDALRAAGNAFLSKTNEHRTIVVLTDGEDQESAPLDIARKMHEEQGVRVFTVGLGDADQGARIPQQGGFVQHQGEQVWSKMNGSVLRAIAEETGGAYIPAGTKQVDMGDVYRNYVANVEETEFESAKINSYIPRFQWFALPALLLLLTEVWWSTRTLEA